MKAPELEGRDIRGSAVKRSDDRGNGDAGPHTGDRGQQDHLQAIACPGRQIGAGQRVELVAI
ncbi:hypothetical protein [Aquisphaera insulae]|uniref:hypothetical protein n=1 Tax=Aquisphaera insulae TaxID=2712864 RepID=UPI0013EC0B2E|nr:hypothetical protein [Aquisphaera insulae]